MKLGGRCPRAGPPSPACPCVNDMHEHASGVQQSSKTCHSKANEGHHAPWRVGARLRQRLRGGEFRKAEMWRGNEITCQHPACNQHLQMLDTHLHRLAAD